MRGIAEGVDFGHDIRARQEHRLPDGTLRTCEAWVRAGLMLWIL